MNRPPPTFAIATSLTNGVACLDLSGEFDARTVPQFEAEVANQITSTPDIDLAVCLGATDIIDSSALGALVRLDAAQRKANQSLTVHAPRPFQVDLLRITGLTQILTIASTCERCC